MVSTGLQDDGGLLVVGGVLLVAGVIAVPRLLRGSRRQKRSKLVFVVGPERRGAPVA